MTRVADNLSFEIEFNGKRVTADEFLESEIKRLTELTCRNKKLKLLENKPQ